MSDDFDIEQFKTEAAIRRAGLEQADQEFIDALDAVNARGSLEARLTEMEEAFARLHATVARRSAAPLARVWIK